MTGLKVVCAYCGTAIGEIVSEIQAGERISESNFKFYGGAKPAGYRMECHVCGEAWFKDGRLHTNRGWICGK
jgi:hypothetical protein